MSCSSTVNGLGLRCRVENKIKNKKNVKRSEWNVLYILWVFVSVCLCVCVVCVLVCLHVSLYSWGQPFFPHLSGESAWVFVCFCILRRDYFSWGQRTQRNFERAFYVLFSEMILRKAFHGRKKKFRLPHPEGHLPNYQAPFPHFHIHQSLLYF